MISDWLAAHFLVIALTVSTLLSWNWLLYFRKQLSLGGITALILAVAHTFAGVLAVKAFAFLEGVPGGMSLYGAVFFLPLLYWIGAKMTKRPLGTVFDVFTVCVILAMMLARINCLRSGCCLGAFLPGSTSLRWPTRELELVFYAVLLLVLGTRIRKGRSCGSAYPIYMVSYGCFRFVIEFLRVNDSLWGPIHLSHIWSLVSILVGAIAWVLISRKNPTLRK